MSELVNFDKLNADVVTTIEKYCLKLLEIHSTNIKSIILYGSATGNEYIKGKSNINLLIAMDRIDPPDLKKSIKLVKKAIRKKIVNLFLTMEHINTSTDTFPIEFLGMKENYITIYGEDILKDLKIDPINIRLQCEQQIKGSLIRLYQIYIETGLKKSRIKSLLINSLTNLIPVFQQLIKLKENIKINNKQQVIDKLCDIYELNKGIFTNILKLKRREKISIDLITLFDDYLEELEKLAIIADKLKLKK